MRAPKEEEATSQVSPSPFLDAQGCEDSHPHLLHSSQARIGGVEKRSLAPSPPLSRTGRGRLNQHFSPLLVLSNVENPLSSWGSNLGTLIKG